MSIKVSFPDGSERVFEDNISVKEIAEGISHSLMKKSVVAVVSQNGTEKVVDLSTKLTADCSLKIITLDTKDTKDKQILLDIMRHSCAHLFAQAMRELYGNKVHFGFGPEVENGFYYDFELTDGTKITTEDFPKIEKKMHELAEKDFEITRKEWDGKELCDFFEKDKEKYKVEQIKSLIETDKNVVLSCKYNQMRNATIVINQTLIFLFTAVQEKNKVKLESQKEEQYIDKNQIEKLILVDEQIKTKK